MARIPGILFAQPEAPIPLPQKAMPRSTVPDVTARPRPEGEQPVLLSVIGGKTHAHVNPLSRIELEQTVDLRLRGRPAQELHHAGLDRQESTDHRRSSDGAFPPSRSP